MVKVFGGASRKYLVQNGMACRTICGDCNSSLLGEYDKEVAKLWQSVREITDSRLYVEGRRLVDTKPQRVARAIVGHALAARSADLVTASPDKSDFGTALRRYIMSSAEPLPKGIEIYSWLYTGQEQIVIQNAVITPNLGGGNNLHLYGHIVKYYPLAFWIVWRPGSGSGRIRLREWLRRRDADIDEVCTVDPLRWPIAPRDFPEISGRQSAMIYPGPMSSVVSDR